MLRLFVIALCVTPQGWCMAAFPYSSVCEILVESGNGYAGGSATLIAVSEDQALLLTCEHVALEAGKEVKINWASLGQLSTGKVLLVGVGQDIAMCICPRPPGLRPVAVKAPVLGGVIVNAGFPGITGTLEWQVGTVTEITETEVTYTCRPIPGMSGGATFDSHGNLVGVITHYGWDSGGSASGSKMIEFVNKFMATTDVQWCQGVEEVDTAIEVAPAEDKINAPEPYFEFVEFIYTEYTGPDTPWSPLLGPKPEPIVEEPEVVSPPVVETFRKSYKARPRSTRKPRGRRLFRRRT